jgi:hypothetical protein
MMQSSESRSRAARKKAFAAPLRARTLGADMRTSVIGSVFRGWRVLGAAHILSRPYLARHERMEDKNPLLVENAMLSIFEQ